MPDLFIMFAIVAVVSLLTMLAPLFGRKILRFRADAKRDADVFEAFKAIMATTGVVLAFALVQANNNLQAAQTLVDKEAQAISDLDRTLLRSGVPALMDLRPQLAAYGETLIAEEWPELEHGNTSPKAEAAYIAFSKPARAFSPPDNRTSTIYEQTTRLLDQLADLRAEIAASADAELPSLFWVTSCGLLLIGVALGTLSEVSLGRIASLGATASAVALLLAFVVIVDRPFEGETAVSPEAIQKTLVVVSHRQP